jgi:GT2 family glycosyltransferase
MAHRRMYGTGAVAMSAEPEPPQAPVVAGLAPVSVMLPTWRRSESALATLDKLKSLTPPPAEILVHVDGGDTVSASRIAAVHEDVTVLTSSQRIGPGGGRNRMLEIASQPFIASFDDDSYPIDADFLNRAVAVMNAYPQAAIVGSTIFHRGETVTDAATNISMTNTFVGCGVLYRKALLPPDGAPYVPLPVAYTMEENDLALRLLDAGHDIMVSPWLRVFHDTSLTHHDSPEITGATLRNLALHAFLRYPAHSTAYAIAQVLNRLKWSLTHGRTAGLLTGLASIPGCLWKHRHLRRPVRSETMRRARALRAGPSATQPITGNASRPNM